MSLVIAFSFISCYSGDTAIVTIHIQGGNTAAAEHPLKVKSLIERFLMLFSSPAYAWSDDRERYSLTITAPDMETIMLDSITPETTSVSLEIPAGLNREITLACFEYEDSVTWLGRSSVSLTAGQESNIVMKMIPVTALTEVYNNGEYMSVRFGNASPYALGYRLYRSNTREGTYTFVANHILGNCEEECWIYDYSTSPSDTYFYKVTVIGEYGEGLPTDPQSNPFPAK